MPSNITINVKEIRANRRRNPSILAEVATSISFGEHVITIDDIRVLDGKKGVWAAMPSFAIPAGGKEYDYSPSVVLSPALAAALEEKVLKAFETWKAKHGTFTNAHGLEVGADDIGF